MVQKRGVFVAIILSIVTCGIYGIYWFIKLTDEANSMVAPEARTSAGGTAFLLTLITCGIYSYYWAYKQGEKLDAAATAKGMPSSSSGVVYLVLCLFGLGIIAYALMQDKLNHLI